MRVHQQMVRTSIPLVLARTNAVCTSDIARMESLKLEDKGARQTARLGYQEDKLKEAKARLEKDRRVLEHHARDMAKAQDKIPSGTPPLFPSHLTLSPRLSLPPACSSRNHNE